MIIIPKPDRIFEPGFDWCLRKACSLESIKCQGIARRDWGNFRSFAVYSKYYGFRIMLRRTTK